MTDNTNTLQLLHTIVQTYESEATSFYGKLKGNKKFVPRFDFKFLARKLFDPFPAEELGDIYVDLLSNVHEYMHMQKKSITGVRQIPPSHVTIPELIFNLILPYQLPYQRFVANVEEKKPAEVEEADDDKKNESMSSASSTTSTRKKRRGGGGAANRKNGKNVTMHPRVVLTSRQAKSLLQHMLKIPLSPESGIWKQAKYILCPNGSSKLLAEFGEIIAACTQSGMISFAALNFFMHDEVINKHMQNPATILHALYLGPLTAQTVEIFAANRSNVFRDQCREILRVAIEASKDPFSFQLKQPENIPANHTDRVRFKQFVTNVQKLIHDLSGEEGEATLHIGWACAALKKFGHKRYVDKTWKDENYYDLIWTVLAQRPNLKRFVCDLLEKFNDHDAAKYWRRIQPHQMFKNYIKNSNVTMEDPLKPTQDFVNFPSTVSSIRMISTDQEVCEFIGLLEELIAFGKPVLVGVDAEWSAYVSPSRATILQMALYEEVYILDLESPRIERSMYARFLQFFFGNSNIVKIGFQFGEDLHQLRSAFKSCTTLYEPRSVICVGRLITDFLAEIKRQKIGDERRRELLPLFADDGASEADTSIDDSAKEDDEEDEEDGQQTGKQSQQQQQQQQQQQPFSNKGLSFFCEKILGRPLDKTEQCSVWDRRPLRNLQMRYAAMDAYCMLLLYDKMKWAFEMIGTSVEEWIDKQEPICVSLPLLSECPL